MLLLFDSYLDAIKSKEPPEPKIDQPKVEQSKVNKPYEQTKRLEQEDSKIMEPELEQEIKPIEITYPVKCNFCKKSYFITSDYLVLRKIHGEPVDSFNCKFCKKRNYIFTQDFTLNLLKELAEYKK